MGSVGIASKDKQRNRRRKAMKDTINGFEYNTDDSALVVDNRLGSRDQCLYRTKAGDYFLLEITDGDGYVDENNEFVDCSEEIIPLTYEETKRWLEGIEEDEDGNGPEISDVEEYLRWCL